MPSMYDLNSNLLSLSGLTAAELEAAENSVHPGNGYNDFQAFVDAESKYGINALFILAHADVESAHGTSYYAQTRNNLFGFNAIDSNPNEASSYASQAESIDFYGNFLKTYYLTPGGVYYNGETPHGVFVRYSSSGDTEAESVVGLMNTLQDRVNGPVEPATPPAPSSTATYHVVPNENLTEISAQYPGTTVDDWVNTNKSKYPQITPDYIQADWNLVIPGSHAPVAPASEPQAPQEVRITVPPAPEGDLSNLAAQYGSTVDEIVAWNVGQYPQLTPDFVEAGWTNFRVK